MLRKIGKTLVGVVVGLGFAASNAAAAVTIDATEATTDVTSAALVVIGVLVIIWGARKVFSFLGR